jgi:hypothetical protein
MKVFYVLAALLFFKWYVVGMISIADIKMVLFSVSIMAIISELQTYV